MNINEMYWLAGLLEGEGCFTIGNTQSPMISLGMNDKDIIEHAANLLGNLNIEEKTTSSGHTRYRISLNGKDAVSAMIALKPLMGERRQQRILEVLHITEGRPRSVPRNIIFPELESRELSREGE
uniref:Putative homing endonuclease n=1 Tax=viral metagenome TaxID=1070528 RepID=A0A6H1ZAX7_9ZZZZ